MEYVYAAMLLHAAKKDITESAVSSILKAAGVEADSARVKALVASLKNVNIDEAIKQAAVQAVAPQAPASHAVAGTAKKEEQQDDDGKAAEAAAEGLGSLFG